MGTPAHACQFTQHMQTDLTQFKTFKVPYCSHPQPHPRPRVINHVIVCFNYKRGAEEPLGCQGYKCCIAKVSRTVCRSAHFRETWYKQKKWRVDFYHPEGVWGSVRECEGGSLTGWRHNSVGKTSQHNLRPLTTSKEDFNGPFLFVVTGRQKKTGAPSYS